MNTRNARIWFGATALTVFFGVVVQLFVSANLVGGHFNIPAKRALNVFAFFTVQSNLIVGVTCLMLALNPTRSSAAFRTLRLTGVVSIAITGVVSTRCSSSCSTWRAGRWSRTTLCTPWCRSWQCSGG